MNNSADFNDTKSNPTYNTNNNKNKNLSRSDKAKLL